MGKRQKKIVGNYLKLGQDFDGALGPVDNVLDQRAPIWLPIQLKQPQAKMTVQFATHQEQVSRETWTRLITQHSQQVTEKEFGLRSIVLDESNQQRILFVNPKTVEFQTLTIVSAPREPNFRKAQLWTGHYPGVAAVLKQLRGYLSNQSYTSCSFEMYAFLRKIADGELVISHQGANFYRDASNIAIAKVEADVLQKLIRHGLIVMMQRRLGLTSLGMSFLNYFARFYEIDYQKQLTQGQATFNGGQIKLQSSQRKSIQLPREVIKDDK